jgi:hypothetical protein
MLPLTSEELPQLAESPVESPSEAEHLSPSASESNVPEFDADMFEKLLQHECQRWQHKLRLQDWNVKVVLCRLNEMSDREALAEIFPSVERKDAVMRILMPADVELLSAHYLNNEEINYGLTIVHELIHLHLWPFCQNQTAEELVAEEQAVNALSRCIVGAYASKIKPLLPSGSVKPVGHYL